jgi:hypothetical protein
VNPFIRDHKIGYTVLMGDDGVLAAYQIEALPLTYLIDSNGHVAARYQGVVDHDNVTPPRRPGPPYASSLVLLRGFTIHAMMMLRK